RSHATVVLSFYYSVTQFLFHTAVPAQYPGMVSYFIEVSANPTYRYHQTLLLVHFKANSPSSILGGRAAPASVIGRTHHELFLTTVNMSIVFNSLPAMDSVLRIDIPADLTVIAEEVVKVPASELLCYRDEISSFVYRQEDTQVLFRDHFAGSDRDAAQGLQVSLVCPLSQKKIVVPCRGVRCRHVQRFDVSAYLGCNEGTGTPP
ncbi:hypothetical protein V5799_029791, partial [Amblyomma americanum]